MSLIVSDYLQFRKDNPKIPRAVAAVLALIEVMKRSQKEGVLDFILELREQLDELVIHIPNITPMSLLVTCELFMLYITRFSSEGKDLVSIKQVLIEKGSQIKEISLTSRSRISEFGRKFVHDGSTVLTHGNSPVVLELLARAAQTKNFTVMVTEGRPECSGYALADKLLALKVPVQLVLDAAVASVIHRVDCVIVGAEAVCESGGIVNKLGTFQLALAAKEFDKPFFVAAESYKFSRSFPLTQADLPKAREMNFMPCVVKNAKCEPFPEGADTTVNTSSDLTPPRLITLLFTDMGVFTPSAISDELTKMYKG